MKKRIAINLLQFSHKSATGSFIYIKNLLDNLFPMDGTSSYFLLLPLSDYAYFKKRYGSYKNVRFKIVDFRSDLIFNPVRAILKLWAKIKKDHLWAEAVLRTEVENFLTKRSIQLYFSPSGAIYPKGLGGVKIVTTILDLQHEYFPENFNQCYLKRRKNDSVYAITHSDRILSISDYTKKTIIEKYGIDGDKITTTYLAPQEIKSGDCHPDLPKEFIFYPAALWPHKNHKILVGALNLLKEKFPNLNLVFSGVIKNECLKKEIEAMAAAYNLSERVRFLGYVSEEMMACLYKNAKILTYPSSFEGFGIPIVEAFNFGLPVIAANNSSITEVLGDAGILYKTGDLMALTVAIERVLTDQNIKEDLIARGRERVKKFSWRKATLETIAVFNSL